MLYDYTPFPPVRQGLFYSFFRFFYFSAGFGQKDKGAFVGNGFIRSETWDNHCGSLNGMPSGKFVGNAFMRSAALGLHRCLLNGNFYKMYYRRFTIHRFGLETITFRNARMHSLRIV